jgi:hypothetical protein
MLQYLRALRLLRGEYLSTFKIVAGQSHSTFHAVQCAVAYCALPSSSDHLPIHPKRLTASDLDAQSITTSPPDMDVQMP